VRAGALPDPADPRLVARLVGWARRLAGRRACWPVVLLGHRTDELVVRAGEVVVKAHAPGVRLAGLRWRLTLAGRLAGVMVTPCAAAEFGGRTVTLWPAGTALREADLPAVDWAAIGGLLAALHRAPVPAGRPGCGAPARVARARDRLLAGPSATGRRTLAVIGALATVPAWMRGAELDAGAGAGRGAARDHGNRPRTLVHGDFHLGQLVRHAGRWRLIDVDDLGLGDPAWDLARPAAWFAAGVLDPAEWAALVAGYRAGGGPAIPPDGDPWPALDPFARALTAQIAALAVVNGDLDVAETYVACCRRIAAMYPRCAPGE
jgi:aminoglycoside phosphotransferase (APT) family kinase protein